MTDRHFDRSPIPLDHDVALKLAATRLRQRLDETITAETISRYLDQAYADVGDRAKVATWLPLLAERLAEQQLTGLSRVEHRSGDGRRLVLFLSRRDAGRSQMAQAFFARLAGDRPMCWSGGSYPATHLNDAAVRAMAEQGLDISAEDPKPWTDEIIRTSDIVVTMGCGDLDPSLPGIRQAWDVADPDWLELTEVRQIRDDIESRVRSLLEQLTVTPAG